MKRTPFAAKHRIENAINWYGSEYTFTRKTQNEYGEPVVDPENAEVIVGIYHSSQRSFLELLNTEAASIKSKTNIGIMTYPSESRVQQGDRVSIHNLKYRVTAVEPVLYGDVEIAIEISLEEILDGDQYEV